MRQTWSVETDTCDLTETTLAASSQALSKNEIPSINILWEATACQAAFVGRRQRVGIARALAVEPLILLLARRLRARAGFNLQSPCASAFG